MAQLIIIFISWYELQKGDAEGPWVKEITPQNT